jgi:isocitrate/isopropylmalate dehydrogenase
VGRRIAVIPGDGVGREVVPEGIKVIAALGLTFDFGVAISGTTLKQDRSSARSTRSARMAAC